MKDAQKPDHVSLNTLIGRLKEGRFLVPDFQREFEWKPWDIRDLMRSILLDYYIGSLLLWKGKKENFDALSCEPLYGVTSNGGQEFIVLDGQQRLTALNYAFLAPDTPLPNRTKRAVYYVRVDQFMAEEYDKAFNYDFMSRRIERLLANKEQQFASHIFPLPIIGQGGRRLYRWFGDYEEFWKDRLADAESKGNQSEVAVAREHATNARAFEDYVTELIEQYQVSYIELDQDLGVDKVCDIFTQINSRGIRLDVFDLMNALLKPKGLQLKHMWRKAAARLEFVDSSKMNVYILQVMSILRQSYCSPKYLYFLIPGHEKPIRDPDGTRRKEVLVPDISNFQSRWSEAVIALEAAIRVVRHPQDFGAISPKYLPYVSILPAFAALLAVVSKLRSEQQLKAHRKVRHWYWASVFTNRYSGSVESTSARDYLDVKKWISNEDSEPAPIQEFKSRFRSLELRKETKRGTSVYNGIFNLFVIGGARDWVTGAAPQHDDLDDHHIVPASWGGKYLGGNIIHTILNRTPLTGDTNRRVIGEKLPNRYLPDWMATNGEDTVRSILESHFISRAAFDILLRDPFTTEDFDAFITERQRSIQEAIENLLIKEPLDLPANLRDLDQAIESVELALRRVIDVTLAGEVAQLPQHILQKANERIQRMVRKDPTFEAERCETLNGLLEFCDLRDLQDAIASKATWCRFRKRFANKDALIKKFDQLSELRNGIRHSRSVDEIIQMEGQAAITWFQKVL